MAFNVFILGHSRDLWGSWEMNNHGRLQIFLKLSLDFSQPLFVLSLLVWDNAFHLSLSNGLGILLYLPSPPYLVPLSTWWVVRNTIHPSVMIELFKPSVPRCWSSTWAHLYNLFMKWNNRSVFGILVMIAVNCLIYSCLSQVCLKLWSCSCIIYTPLLDVYRPFNSSLSSTQVDKYLVSTTSYNVR